MQWYVCIKFSTGLRLIQAGFDRGEFDVFNQNPLPVSRKQETLLKHNQTSHHQMQFSCSKCIKIRAADLGALMRALMT